MVLRPEDLERAEFEVVDSGGLDAAAVADLLGRAAERIRALEQDGLRAVGGTVAEMLDQAVKSSENITADATAEADNARTDATTEAKRITDEAAKVAAKQIADAERAASDQLEQATNEADSVLKKAHSDAVERSTQVLNQAQLRLDRLLAAERDVHDNLRTALADIQASVARVGVDQAAELALTVEELNLSVIDETKWAEDEPEDEVSARRRSA